MALYFDKQKLTTDDIKGNNSIAIFRKYIQKVCGIATTDLDAEFNKLSDYRMIRNNIVHALSDVLEKTEKQPIEKQQLYMTVKRYGIKVDDDFHFYILAAFSIKEGSDRKGLLRAAALVEQ